MSNRGLEPVCRPLTDEETELVFWLIKHADSDRQELAAQVANLSVFERCSCGCPTIYFASNGVPVSRKGERVVSDYLGSVDGEEVGVMLFQTSTQLSSLEAYSCSGLLKGPFSFPKIDTLRPV
jgi:hypothetical protein